MIPMDPASGVVIVVGPFTFSNIFSSETAWPIKAKFYVEPSWEGGTEVCINGPGHMTKMAAMPIYGKNLKKSCMYTTLGQGQEIALTFNTRISSYIQLDVCS